MPEQQNRLPSGKDDETRCDITSRQLKTKDQSIFLNSTRKKIFVLFINEQISPKLDPEATSLQQRLRTTSRTKSDQLVTKAIKNDPAIQNHIFNIYQNMMYQ